MGRDCSAVPLIALRQVEVLRDGAMQARPEPVATSAVTVGATIAVNATSPTPGPKNCG